MSAAGETVAELERQAHELAPQVAQVTGAIRAVAKGERVGLESATAVSVLTKSGYVRYSDRAHRLMLTDEGKKFYRSMKKFGY